VQTVALIHRSREPEAMDAPAPDPVVIGREYSFLRWMHRHGGLAESLVEAVAGLRSPEAVSVIDLGSGPGDLALSAVERAGRRGIALRATCVDRIPPRRQDAPSVEVHTLDLFDAPQRFGPRSFDVAHASLVLHHLSDGDVQKALVAMARLARHRVVWTDLVRDRIGCAGAWASACLQHPQVRKDAVTSVRRSFTLDEAVALAESVGWRDIHIRRCRGACFTLVASPGEPPERRPMIRAERLTVQRGSVPVLRDASCVVHSGQVLHVRGPNGSGKSSLLRCLSGSLHATSGRAWVDRSGGDIGIHPQDGGLISTLSVEGNIQLAATLAGMRGQVAHRAIRRALGTWGLESSATAPARRLSGGEARRAALAATFVHGPRVIVLDEPDAGLDAHGRATLAACMERTLVEGGAVLMAAHSADVLRSLSDAMKATPMELA
jgi:ABC-type Mn2+/Zn2+ transport system ATPase subunit/ubiquinone/menaquinone biosynthesis C-methylase UbiE